jgi:hypothetical protein
MADMMATRDVVAAVARERDRLLRGVDALGPRAATVAVTEEDGWTAKDVLGHLIHSTGLSGAEPRAAYGSTTTSSPGLTVPPSNTQA